MDLHRMATDAESAARAPAAVDHAADPAPQPAPQSVIARRVDHVGIAVHDADASARHFAERFGMKISQVAELDDGSARLVYLEVGDSTVQLVQPLRDGPVARHLAEHGEGLHHVCFAVDALLPALAALPDEGDRAGTIYRGGRGCDVVFLEGRSAGVLVELTEPGSSIESEDGR